MTATAIAPLRVGVAGVGRIGRMHAELLMHEVPGAAVVAVYDVSTDSAQAAAEALGVERADTLDALFLDADAVAICTSTDTHADLIVAAAQAGKAIFCEKPVSLDLATLDRCLAAVREAGVPLQVGFNRRFDPAHAAVAAAVAEGRVGEPHLLRITSRDPAPPPIEYLDGSGGIFLDMTIHDFDMARFVTRLGHRRGLRRAAPCASTARSRRPGDVDTAVVTLLHASGCLTTIDNSRRAVYGYDQRVEVFGPGGMASSENVRIDGAVITDAGGTHVNKPEFFFLDRYAESYRREWDAFVRAIAEGEPPAVSAEDARAPLVVGLAAQRSLAEGRSVPVAEIDPA